MTEKTKNEFGLEAERRAFFGRRSSHKLYSTQQKLVEELLPHIEIDLEKGQPDLNRLFGDRVQAPLFLEIGYGGGEHLARHARTHPENNYIGCEPFMGGVGKMLSYIDRQALENAALPGRCAASFAGVAGQCGVGCLSALPRPMAEKEAS